jgi:hypothetical protein
MVEDHISLSCKKEKRQRGKRGIYKKVIIDSDVVNDPPSSANTAVPAGFAWLLSRAKGALTT